MNRTYICGSQGVEVLIIPISHSRKKQYYKDVRIDYSTKWYLRHARAIAAAYGKAPYYHAIMDLLYPILSKRPSFLLDLNRAMLEAIIQFVQLPCSMGMMKGYLAARAPEMVDLRAKLHPKRQAVVIEEIYLPAYRHLFGHPFIPNLSVIDLLFCEGPYADTLFQQLRENS